MTPISDETTINSFYEKETTLLLREQIPICDIVIVVTFNPEKVVSTFEFTVSYIGNLSDSVSILYSNINFQHHTQQLFVSRSWATKHKDVVCKSIILAYNLTSIQIKENELAMSVQAYRFDDEKEREAFWLRSEDIMGDLPKEFPTYKDEL
jgi:hypothetical protein